MFFARRRVNLATYPGTDGDQLLKAPGSEPRAPQQYGQSNTRL